MSKHISHSQNLIISNQIGFKKNMPSLIRLMIFSILILVSLPNKLTVAQACRLNDTNPWSTPQFVYLRNSIHAILTLQCWSKDDDLGFHELQAGEYQTFIWTYSLGHDLLATFSVSDNLIAFLYINNLENLCTHKTAWEIRPNDPCIHELQNYERTLLLVHVIPNWDYK